MLFRIIKLASSWWAGGIIVVVFLITLFQIYVTAQTGTILSGFYTSLTSLNLDLFQTTVINACGLIILSSLIDSVLQGTVSILGWYLRQTLNSKLSPLYFEKFYSLGMDNPDQRITHDIVQWSNDSSNFIAKLILAPATVIYYSVQTGLYIGWYAPLIVYAWFGVGYLSTSYLIHRLATLVGRQDSREGSFRYNYAKIRNEAESLAISGGASVEYTHSTALFDRVMMTSLQVICWQLGLSAVSNFFTYLITIVNYGIVALPLLVWKTLKFKSESAISGYVAKATFDAISLAGGLSIFLNLSSLFSNLIGFSNRLGQLVDELESPCTDQVKIPSPSNSDYAVLSILPTTELVSIFDEVEGYVEEVSDRIELRNVSIQIPGQETYIIRNLSFICHRGHNLLIRGPSGSGKTSIQRILSGVWTVWEGTIFKPSTIHYIPAAVYLPRLPLAAQLTYPSPARLGLRSLSDSSSQDTISEAQIKDLLARVHLSYLYDRETENCGTSHWTDTLSSGEKQRLAFARLLYHQPAFACLDEATSALPLEMERHLYLQCENITLISIGHRESLLEFHDQVLDIATINATNGYTQYV